MIAAPFEPIVLMTPTPHEDDSAEALPSGWGAIEGQGEDSVEEGPCEPRGAALAADEGELARLVQRIVYQDEAALSVLYRTMASRVYRQAVRLTREMTTAEEVVEDVFWQVWRQAPRFDPQRGGVSAWLMQLARSRAIDALRALGRSALHSALQLDVARLIEDAAEQDASQRLDDKQLAERIDEALRSLDPLRRQLVSLAFHSGLSHDQIAAQTGLPLGTVKSNIRRGLAAMKAALDQTIAGNRRAGEIT